MNGNSFGRLFQVATFGESHGEAMGCTVSGCPAGLELTEADIQEELDRRRPGQSKVTTSRDEPDAVSIKSGIQDGYTTGTPIGMVIQNKDAQSGKFGTRNWGGGGRSSARETANWVAAGAVAKKILEQYDIRVASHVNQIGNVRAPDDLDFERILEHRDDNEVRCAHAETAERMREKVEEYQRRGDSIGSAGYFEIQGLPRGLGSPRFDSFPARMGKGLFAIPAVSAVETGLGKETAGVTGYDRNEDWEFNEDDDPEPVGNDHGGTQGGITTGQTVYGEVTWHAPVSIPKEQTTVDWETGEEKEVQVIGRHDPVLAPRGVVVVEAVLALTALDFMLLSGRINPDRLDGQVGEYETEYHPRSPLNVEEDEEHAVTEDD